MPQQLMATVCKGEAAPWNQRSVQQMMTQLHFGHAHSSVSCNASRVPVHSDSDHWCLLNRANGSLQPDSLIPT